MAVKKGLIGMKFGRWFVLEEVLPKIHKYIDYLCICETVTFRELFLANMSKGKDTEQLDLQNSPTCRELSTNIKYKND